jgi:hypothetical protein
MVIRAVMRSGKSRSGSAELDLEPAPALLPHAASAEILDVDRQTLSNEKATLAIRRSQLLSSKAKRQMKPDVNTFPESTQP